MMNTSGEPPPAASGWRMCWSICTSATRSIVSTADSQVSQASASGVGGGRSAGGCARTETVVQRCTPILFSTNRGLHLRVNKPQQLARTETLTSLSPASATGAYEIRFCDLERWSTNRANTVSLQDSIVSSRTFTVAIPPSQRASFIPVKQRSSIVRLNNTSLRFGEEE